MVDVHEVIADGKDTPGVLRPLLAKRGDGGANKSCDVAAFEALPFDSAGSTRGNLDPLDYHLSAAIAHVAGAPKKTPCMGSTSLVRTDGCCPPGGGNDTDGAAGDSTSWVPVLSMVRRDHQGATP